MTDDENLANEENEHSGAETTMITWYSSQNYLRPFFNQSVILTHVCPKDARTFDQKKLGPSIKSITNSNTLLVLSAPTRSPLRPLQ